MKSTMRQCQYHEIKIVLTSSTSIQLFNFISLSSSLILMTLTFQKLEEDLTIKGSHSGLVEATDFPQKKGRKKEK